MNGRGLTDEDYDSILHSTCLAAIGDRGSGKTALAFHLLDKVKDRPVFIFDHPKPWLVQERGWNVMHRLEELYEIDNAVCFVDEPQLSIPTLDKRANTGLQKLLSIARHRDISLVLATCDSRWISRALEAYVSTWLIKDTEPRLLKQGSLAKRIIAKHVICDSDEFHLKPSQFLFYNRNLVELDGMHSFNRPEWFTDEWSKPYSIPRAETAPELRENCADVPTELRQKLIVPTRNGKVNV